MDQDLRTWLTAVWQSQSKGEPDLDRIYAEYERKVPSERTFLEVEGEECEYPDIFVPDDIMNDAADPDNPDTGAVMFAQRAFEEWDKKEDLLEVGGENTGYGYLYTKSPTFVDDAGTHRVVVHARPYNKLIKIMRLVVRDILKAGGRFQNVNGAKVMTPACFQSGRNDTLIIYTRDLQAAQAVVTQLRTWIYEGLFSADDFVDRLPKTIKREARGIGRASEPPSTQVLEIYPEKPSYGRFLSQIIYIAVDIARSSGRINSEQDFLRVAKSVLRSAGIDPKFPYEFSAMQGIFTSSIPWKKGVARRWTPLYEKLMKDIDVMCASA